MTCTDEETLLVTKLLVDRRHLTRLQKRLLAAQERLREVSSEEAWGIYLLVEELTNKLRGEECRLWHPTIRRRSKRR